VRPDPTDPGEASLREIIAKQPANAEALMHLGSLTLRTGRAAEAERLFDRMSVAAPTSPAAFNGRGIALAGLGRLDEACACFDQALSLNPRDADCWANRGLALTELVRFEEALTNFAKALECRPRFPAVHNNIGLALHRTGRFQQAVASFDKAIDADPDYAYAHFNQSLSLLALGDYERGWREYEWRWKSALAGVKPDFPAPIWRNDFPIHGRTILVHAEQGLGDSLQFCRYVPMLAAIANVVLVVPKPLTRLLSGMARIGTTETKFDAWIPMMSLPLAFGAAIPNATPYLHADPERTAVWRERLRPLHGRKIGLVWAGSPRTDDPGSRLLDRRRSIPLETYAPLASVTGISLISLQKGAPAAQAPPGMVLHDWTGELDDFADTAALIEALDLVISVDTSVAHLAGALGKPVWILNRNDQCWRWLNGRTDSPWYPSARLFRQPAMGDWASVIHEVTAALRTQT